MAASLSASANNSSLNGSSMMGVSIPRRRLEKPSSTAAASSASFLANDSESIQRLSSVERDERGGARSGHRYPHTDHRKKRVRKDGDESPNGKSRHKQPNSHTISTQSRQEFKKKQQQTNREDEETGDSQSFENASLSKRKDKVRKERGSSASSSTSSSSSKAERRSSVSSNVSSSSSSSGGFRRLKKFKSPTSSSAAAAATTTSSPSSTVSARKKPEAPSRNTTTLPDKSADELSVSENFQQTQLRLWKAAQERHQKLQEQREQQRLKKGKKKKTQHNNEDDSDPSLMSSFSDKGSVKPKKAKKQRSNLEEDDTIIRSEGSSDVSDTQVMDGDDEAAARRERKKLKKLNKFKRLQQQKGDCEGGDAALVASATELKKRLLIKGEDDSIEAPRKKKAKKTFSEVDSELQEDCSQSTPSKEKLSISDTALLTPSSSFGLADTVKTRVRSCNKQKDELELLQAASFEKKKRKKHKSGNKEKLKPSQSEKTALKRKKKKKRQQMISAAGGSSGEKQFKAHKADALVDYEADVEAPLAEPLSCAKRKSKSSKVVDSLSDAARSETLSSGSIATGFVEKKRKKKKKEKSLRMSMAASDETSTAVESKSDHVLPLKKRMAMPPPAPAPPADCVSSSWERNAISTTASKISISSAGTGPGATPELEASSISEFTHPLGPIPLAPAFPIVCQVPKVTSVPREILSKAAPLAAPTLSSSFNVNVNPSTVIGPPISSDDSDSDSSSDSDTDEEEFYSFANMMFGTSARPTAKEAKEQKELPTPETSNLTPEMCEMEKRRQKQEEERTLTMKEVNAILNEEMNHQSSAVSQHWVRRSVRQPNRSLLNAPLVRKLLDKLRGNDNDMVVLKLKKYLSDPDTPQMVIDATLDALEENTNCEALYIQNFNLGMRDKQVLHLLKILQMPSCNIWCLNIGETYNVSEETWEIFAEGLKDTKVTHMYASEHTITTELKDEIRETIRRNRSKHNMHNDPNNLDVIVRCTHNWWNPINAKVLRPYLRKRGFESLLHDKEAQGLRGSSSEAPSA